jgi:hypothetical protein
MIPILFPQGEEDFTSNGLGRLADATDCTVTEERNGAYELTMTYPITGVHFSDITHSKIIFAKPAQVIITVKENNGKCNRGDFKNQIKEFYNKKSISYETFLRFMGDYGTGRVEILRNERGKYYIHRVEPE